MQLQGVSGVSVVKGSSPASISIAAGAGSAVSASTVCSSTGCFASSVSSATGKRVGAWTVGTGAGAATGAESLAGFSRAGGLVFALLLDLLLRDALAAATGGSGVGPLVRHLTASAWPRLGDGLGTRYLLPDGFLRGRWASRAEWIFWYRVWEPG